MNQEAYPDALPAHYRLHWYELERVLGQGGFGITYLAHDHNLDLQVAIKEYLPINVAQRRSDASLRPRTQPLDERYRWGLGRFIDEARTLARFDHPNIVRVQSVFEANDTAYIVMRFEQGENLGTLLDRRGKLGQDELLRVLLPVLDGLERVHEAGFIHRDIKPANIHIRSDGSPVLLDFGSARVALGRSQSMTVLVAPGYAPLEQYDAEADTQGPWTDIYGLAATAYRAIAGVPPPDAVLRARGRLGSTADTLVPASSVGEGSYSTSLLAAIDHGLQLAEADRPQSVAAWRQELIGDTPKARPAVAPPAARPTAPASRAPARVAGLPPGPAPAAQVAVAARSYRLPLVLSAGALFLAGGAWLIWPRAAPAPAGETVGHDASAVSPDRAAAASAAASAASALPTAASSVVPPAAGEAIVPSATSRATEAQGKPPISAMPVMPERRVVAPTSRPAERAIFAASAATTIVPVTGPASAASAAAAAVVAVGTPAAPAPVAAPVAIDPMAAANDALSRGDNAEADRLARALASQGNAGAMELLGRMAEEGRGTARNAQQAYIWYSLALQRGHSSARASAERVKRLLLPADIAQADRLVQNWRPQ